MKYPRRTALLALLGPPLLGSWLGACGAGGEGPAASEGAAGDGHDHTHDASDGHDHPDGGHDHFDASTTGPGDAGVPDGSVIDGFEWDLPPGFPVPKVPEDNPMSEAKVELGRHLFYDERLSANQSQSCGTCHQQALAFTDGRATGLGSTGEAHPRASMALANVAYAATLTWANPALTALERQALVPLFGESPVELGFAAMEDELLRRLRAEPTYQAMFAAAFSGDDEPIALHNVTRALAAFQRVLLSGRSRVDRHEAGELGALNESELRGKALFFGEEAECFHCHGGFNFSDSVTYVGKVFDEFSFHNTGLYNLGGTGAYPEPNEGLYNTTGEAQDMGRFKAPSLRNVAVTAPYMHDGSIATLDEVIDHYAVGGRTVPQGPNASVGRDSPYKSEFVSGFDFSAQQKADLVAFLRALTDEEFLTDPRFADPHAP